MARPEVVAFSDEHLAGAAALLAERHLRHHAAEPLLSARYEDPAAAAEELERAWRAPGASGAAAVHDGRLAGYLVGAPRERPVWGPHVWIEAAGHAVDDAELVRDLYAVAAARWVEEGRTRHYALVPATDAALVDAWFRLCFGAQQAHGVREVPADSEVVAPEGFELRPPEAGEVELLIDVDLALPQHQRASPIFSGVELPTRDDSRAEWLETLAGTDEEIVIAATDDGRPVACWAIAPAEGSGHHNGLARPDDASYLGFAVTLPEFRGRGLGVALTDALLARAREQGYRSMVTDWRVTNLLASRFWPRRGFRTSFLRLYRSIP